MDRSARESDRAVAKTHSTKYKKNTRLEDLVSRVVILEGGDDRDTWVTTITPTMPRQ